MLNRNFALALAAAMVLAALYGCSSNSGIKDDRDMFKDRAETAEAANTALMNRIYGMGGTADAPTPDSLMGRLNAANMSNTGLMNRIYGEGGTADAPTDDSLMGRLDASGMSNTGLMEQIYGEGGTADAPTDDSLMGRLDASGMSNTGLMEQIYGEGGTADAPTDDSLMGRLDAADVSNTGLMEQIYGMGGTADAPTDDSLMGRLNASGMSNTGLMEQIYGMGGTADAPTPDSLMGRLDASGMSNTGLMEQIYGEGGTADAPTPDSLMGRLDAADVSNTGLMEQIYGMGGTADAPTPDSLMGRLDAADVSNTGLMEQIYGMGGTADAPTPDSLMGRLNAANTMLYGEGGTAEDPTDESLVGQSEAVAEDKRKLVAANMSAMAEGIMPQLVDSIVTGAPTIAGSLSYDDGAELSVMDFEETASADQAPWTALTLEKEDETTETIMIYTDIGGKQPKSLLADEIAGTFAFFAITDGDGDMAGEAFIKNAVVEGLPSAPTTGTTTVLLGSDVTPPGEETARLELTGSWRGVDGTFICTSTNCNTDDSNTQITVTATTDEDGAEVLEATFGTDTVWVFQPDNVKAEVMVPDDEYVWFGWWKSLPEAPEGNYDFTTFAGGTPQYEGGDMGAVTGKAKYVGLATGKYVIQGGSRFKPVFEPGLFTATATLNADFDDENVAGTISGEITDFEGDAAVDSTWEVKLEEVSLSSGNAMIPDGVATASISGSESNLGEWSGEFLGSGDQPGAVVGEFHASFDDMAANIAGAFGAHRQGPEE